MQDRLSFLEEIILKAGSNATEKYNQLENSVQLENTSYNFYSNLSSGFLYFIPIVLIVIFMILFYKNKRDYVNDNIKENISISIQKFKWFIDYLTIRFNNFFLKTIK